MLPAARINDMHVCPMMTPVPPGAPIPHVGGQSVMVGAINVLIGGMPAARVGDICICVLPAGPVPCAPIVKGSATVLIGGMPAARVGDTTAHGGSIVVGCPTVLIGG